VAAGGTATCVVYRGGGMSCFGDNLTGQLGLGSASWTPTYSPRPVRGMESAVEAVLGHPEADISHYAQASCAVLASGDLACWGANDYGQLGDTSAEDIVPVPEIIPGVGEVRDVAVGDAHVCAALSSGEVWCWGQNLAGQLGDGTIRDRAEPRPVPGVDDAELVRAGFRTTCALHADGRVSCWGSNYWGELGSGEPILQLTPEPIMDGP